MKLEARLAWCLAAALLATAAFAQDAQDERYDEDGRPRRATEIPTEGFWPTQKMVERVLDKLTEQMAEQYELDEEQFERTRALLYERIPTFLNSNRAEIQTLMNQYFEALLDDEPPAVDDVAFWAQRVQPLLGDFGQLAEQMTTDMREYLTEDQELMLDAEFAAFQAGFKMAQNKMAVWADGGYDPETEWIHPGPQRRQREREEREKTREAMEEARREVLEGQAGSDASGSPGGVAKQTPKDEWAVYTEQFIERYQLNVEQKQKAQAILRRQQEERDEYLRRKTDEMARITKLLKEAETEAERKAALEAYDKLNAAVEQMFAQLKERLDKLPTRAQRRAAVAAGLEVDGREPARAVEPGAAETGPGAGATTEPAVTEEQPQSQPTEEPTGQPREEPARQPPSEVEE